MDLSKEYFKSLRNKILDRCDAPATLAIISTSQDEASKIYVRNKCKTCTEHNINVQVHYITNASNVNQLYEVIDELNNDYTVNGIILQLPLRDDLVPYTTDLLDSISWKKDVDGLTDESEFRLWTNKKSLKPATAEAVCEILDDKYDSLAGLSVGIIGRSKLIGKPLIKMLLDRDATISVYHSKSPSLKDAFLNNDIVISGVGKDISENYVLNTLWIDCGIIRDADGKVHGDAGSLKNDFITPVPGGVGTLTTACLAENTVLAAKGEDYWIN